MKPVNPESWPQPRGYSNGLIAEGSKVLFIAGQVGWDEAGKFAGGFVLQFELALKNVLQVLRAAGGDATDIGRFTIYIKDKEQYRQSLKQVGKVYRSAMGKHYPAMSLVVVKDLLEDEALVEIEATAVL